MPLFRRRKPEMTVYFVETTVAEQRGLLFRWTERFYMERKRVRVLVDSTVEAQSVDQLLWAFSQGSFIPHAILTPGAPPSDEPVLITPGVFDLDGFDALVCDVPADPAFMGRFERAVHFILRDDEGRRNESRDLWQKIRKAGHNPVHVPYKGDI